MGLPYGIGKTWSWGVAFDLGIVPVGFMLIYQFTLIGFICIHKVEGIYSFCYYVLVGIGAKAFTDKLLKIEKQTS
jgi:hypothetical protein